MDDAFDPEMLVQADVTTRVVSAAGASRRFEQTTTPIATSAWTTFGPVAPDELPPQPSTTVRWTREADGAMAAFEVVGGGDGAASAAMEATLGSARQLGPVLPPGKVAPGASWSDDRAWTIPLAAPELTGALELQVRDHHTFLGWASVEGVRAALITSDVTITGGGVVVSPDHSAELRLTARTAAWAWIDPATGDTLYLLSTSELSVGVGADDDRPSRVRMQLVAGAPPGNTAP